MRNQLIVSVCDIIVSSRIVPLLREGGGVVTPRALVNYVVTEWGIAFLFGKTLQERARALISIAHPDDRSVTHRRIDL